MQKQKTKFKQTEIGMIPEDWKVVKLGSVCEVKSGKRLPKSKTLVEYKTQHPYIRVRDLANGTIKVNELLFLEDETFNKISRYIITKDDIYISIVGTIGLVGLVPEIISGANLTENCARLTNIKKTTKEWLSYFLNTKIGQDQIRSLTVGTTQGKLALFRIKDINIPLSSLTEQQQIVAILSSLDSKIELNQQMNKNLKAIGGAIFKRWFIDFEFPDEKGKPYKSSGKEMIESELGEIPKKWKIENVQDFLMFEKGIEPGSKYYLTKYSKNDIQFIRVGDISTPRREKIFIPLKLAEKKLCKQDDILLSLDATIGIVRVGMEGAFSSGIRKVYSKDKGAVPKGYIYFLLKNKFIQNTIYTYAIGTTILHAGASLDHMNLAIPNNEIFSKFSILIDPIFNKLINNLIEVKNLSQIRDSLLPRLMLGKIRVNLK